MGYRNLILFCEGICEVPLNPFLTLIIAHLKIKKKIFSNENFNPWGQWRIETCEQWIALESLNNKNFSFGGIRTCMKWSHEYFGRYYFLQFRLFQGRNGHHDFEMPDDDFDLLKMFIESD